MAGGRTKGAFALQDFGASWEHPKLKKLVGEASQALARLDAERLEELALSCRALNRDLAGAGATVRVALALEAREAAGEMAVLSRVLDATRSNLQVMNRLRALRAGRFEYGEPQVLGWPQTGSGHGDN
jgi:aminopeptidase N